MHTNYRIFVPNVALPSTSYPPYNGYLYETPESIACVYNLVTQVSGCNPNTAVIAPNGGSQSIAIVDAYDNPTVAGDLAYFSDQMGIPFSPSQFQIVYATGSQPAVDDTGGWEQEAALDVEWAHAMAPKANIYLVEAPSNSDYDLYFAVQVASNLVQCGKSGPCPSGSTGKGEVSMSWGGEEYSTEQSDDVYFHRKQCRLPGRAPAITDVVEYPAASVNVIGVGGTTLARNLSTGGTLPRRHMAGYREAEQAFMLRCQAIKRSSAIPSVILPTCPWMGTRRPVSGSTAASRTRAFAAPRTGTTIGGTSASVPDLDRHPQRSFYAQRILCSQHR